MTPGDSELTVERLQEIIQLTLELEEEIPEEIGLAVQELEKRGGPAPAEGGRLGEVYRD